MVYEKFQGIWESFFFMCSMYFRGFQGIRGAFKKVNSEVSGGFRGVSRYFSRLQESSECFEDAVGVCLNGFHAFQWVTAGWWGSQWELHGDSREDSRASGYLEGSF